MQPDDNEIIMDLQAQIYNLESMVENLKFETDVESDNSKHERESWRMEIHNLPGELSAAKQETESIEKSFHDTLLQKNYENARLVSRIKKDTEEMKQLKVQLTKLKVKHNEEISKTKAEWTNN